MPNLHEIFKKLPDAPQPRSKNPFKQAATQVSAGFKEGTYGIGKGIADLGVATGTVFKDKKLKQKSEKLSQYFNRQLERPDVAIGREVMANWDKPVQKSLRLVANAAPSILSAWTGGGVGALAGKQALKGATGRALLAGGLKATGKKVTKGSLAAFAPKVTGYIGAVGGSIPLGTSIAGSYWEEGVAHGKDPEDIGHYSMALTDGVAQSLLEAMPFMGWMKGGKFATRVARTAIQEGGEEVAQGLFENSLKIVGWKGTENLYNDMMTGISENFVAGALSGGLLGTVPGLTVRKEDIVHDVAKDTYKVVQEQGHTNPDGTPTTFEQVMSKTEELVDAVNVHDGLILPVLRKKLEEAIGIQSKRKATGDHEVVQRAKIQDGQIASVSDDTYARKPLDHDADREATRRAKVLKVWEEIQYKIGGKFQQWSTLPEIIKWNIMNNPQLNIVKDVARNLKKVADEELDRYVVHTKGRENYNNPLADVFFGKLRNETQTWKNSSVEQEKTPDVHGDIWIKDLPGQIKRMGLDPREIEFVGNGADAALKTFISQWNKQAGNDYDKIDIKKTDVKAKLRPGKRGKAKNPLWDYFSTASQRMLDEGGDLLDMAAEKQMTNKEKKIAYRDQPTYVRMVHSAIEKAWAIAQDVAEGHPIMMAAEMLANIAHGRAVIANGMHLPTIQDVAAVMSVFRNPFLEISQVVYIDKDNNVVEHEALSIGMPGKTTVDVDAIKKKAGRLKARYYVLHNHPSGNPAASPADRDTHAMFFDDKNYQGHIILDHENFLFMEPAKKGADKFAWYLKKHEKAKLTNFNEMRQFLGDASGKILGTPEKVTEVANNQFRHGKITLFLTNQDYLISVVYVDADPKYLANNIRKAARANMASGYFLGATGVLNLPKLLPSGIQGIIHQDVAGGLRAGPVDLIAPGVKTTGVLWPDSRSAKEVDLYGKAPKVKITRTDGVSGMFGTSLQKMETPVLNPATDKGRMQQEGYSVVSRQEFEQAQSPVGKIVYHTANKGPAAEIRKKGFDKPIDDNWFNPAGKPHGVWFGNPEDWKFLWDEEIGPRKAEEREVIEAKISTDAKIWLGSTLHDVENYIGKKYEDYEGRRVPVDPKDKSYGIRSAKYLMMKDLVKKLKKEGYHGIHYVPVDMDYSIGNLENIMKNPFDTWDAESTVVWNTEKIILPDTEVGELNDVGKIIDGLVAVGYEISEDTPFSSSVIAPNGTYINAEGGHFPILEMIWKLMGKRIPTQLDDLVPPGYVRKWEHRYSITSVDDIPALNMIKRDVGYMDFDPGYMQASVLDTGQGLEVIIDVQRIGKQGFRHANILANDILMGEDLRGMLVRELRRMNTRLLEQPEWQIGDVYVPPEKRGPEQQVFKPKTAPTPQLSPEQQVEMRKKVQEDINRRLIDEDATSLPQYEEVDEGTFEKIPPKKPPTTVKPTKPKEQLIKERQQMFKTKKQKEAEGLVTQEALAENLKRQQQAEPGERKGMGVKLGGPAPEGGTIITPTGERTVVPVPKGFRADPFTSVPELMEIYENINNAMNKIEELGIKNRVKKFVKRFGAGKELGFLLNDFIAMNTSPTADPIASPEGFKEINSFSIIDLLNELSELGFMPGEKIHATGLSLAESIHARLQEIFNRQQRRTKAENIFKKYGKEDLTADEVTFDEWKALQEGQMQEWDPATTTRADAEAIEQIRSILWHINSDPDIMSRPVIEGSVRGEYEMYGESGQLVSEIARSSRFQSYIVLRRLLSYYSKLTGMTDAQVNKKFGTKFSSDPNDAMINLDKLELPFRSFVKQTAKEQKEGERGFNWFGAIGRVGKKKVGVIPHLKTMLKDKTISDSDKVGIEDKIAELEKVVRWLETGSEAELTGEAKYALGRHKGIPTAIQEFKDEQKAALQDEWKKAGGVYFFKSHLVYDVVEGTHSLVHPGAYELLPADPKDPMRVRLSQDGKTGPVILRTDLETEFVVKNTERGRPLKDKKYAIKKFSKNVALYTTAEIRDMIEHKLVPGKPPANEFLEQQRKKRAERKKKHGKLITELKKIATKKPEDRVKAYESLIKEHGKWPVRIATKMVEEEATKTADAKARQKILDEMKREREEEARREGELVAPKRPKVVISEFTVGEEEDIPEAQRLEEGYVEEPLSPNTKFELGQDTSEMASVQNKTFDGNATDQKNEIQLSERSRFESRKFKIYYKVAKFFLGDEEATLKFLADWVKGGESAIKKERRQVAPASKTTMDLVIETAVKDKNYIKLAQLKGFQVQDLINQEVMKEVQRLYPTLSLKEQLEKRRQWMRFMNDAGEEVISIPGNTMQFTLSEKGIRSPWETGEKRVDGERDHNVGRLTELYELRHGRKPTPQQIGVWKKYRPQMAYWNMLTPALQNIILWNKANVEDTIFFAATPDVLTRADNVNNRAQGYSPRMFFKDKESMNSSSGVSQAIGSQRVPARKMRTYAEFVGETGGSLEAVDNYAASAGWYTKEYLIRIHQHSIIEQFKQVKNPTTDHNIAVITYEEDVRQLSEALGYKDPQSFLDEMGYDRMDNAQGLTKHWRGKFLRPWVHRSVRHTIERFYIEPQERNKYISQINKWAGRAKRLIMMMPHQFALQITSSSWLWGEGDAGERLKKAWVNGLEPMFNPAKIVKGMKLGRERTVGTKSAAASPFKGLQEDFDRDVLNHKKLELFIRHGLRAMNQGWMMEALYDVEKYAKHPMDMNKRERLEELVLGKGGLDNFIFEQYMGKAIYRYAEAMMNRFQKKNPKLTDDQAAQLAVKFVNDTSGTLPSYIYGSEGQWYQFALFARDFTMNFDRQLTGGAYGLMPEPVRENLYKLHRNNKFLNPLFHSESTSAEMVFLSPWYRKHLLFTTSIKIGLFAMLQYALWHTRPEDEREEKDKWMWHNEVAKKAAIKMPGIGPDDHDYYLDPIIWREVSQFMNLLPEEYGGRGIPGVAVSKMAVPLKLAFDAYANEDYMGTPIRDPGANAGKKLAQQIWYSVKQIQPSAFKEQPKELGEHLPSKVLQVFGMPMKRSAYPRGTDEKTMMDLRKRQSSMTFRRGKLRGEVKNASLEKLGQMALDGRITQEQFKNEVLRRQFTEGYFMKRTYKRLLEDEMLYDLYQ